MARELVGFLWNDVGAMAKSWLPPSAYKELGLDEYLWHRTQSMRSERFAKISELRLRRLASAYILLGKNEKHTPEEIKKSYYALAKKHHPDAGGDSAQFQELNKAYHLIRSNHGTR